MNKNSILNRINRIDNKLNYILNNCSDCENNSGGNLTAFNLYSAISCNREGCTYDEEVYIVAYHNGVNSYADLGDSIFIDSGSTTNIVDTEFAFGAYEMGVAQMKNGDFSHICFGVDDTVTICLSG